MSDIEITFHGLPVGPETILKVRYLTDYFLRRAGEEAWLIEQEAIRLADAGVVVLVE